MTLQVPRPALAMAASVALLVGGCGTTDDSGSDAGTNGVAADGGLAALPANFDLAAGSPQAFLLGLVGPEQRAIAYGSIELSFAYIGPVDQPLPEPRSGLTATATFLGVSGTQVDSGTIGPEAVPSSQARGVYATEPLTFADPGFWEVTASVNLDGTPAKATAAFEVLPRHQVPAVGDTAPSTAHPVLGDPAVAPAAIDSRAHTDDPIPDPELHTTTIAAALDHHRPLTVVISTPTYCTSRFCGPITDTVSTLAGRYADRMVFVHLEVWSDFEKRQVNPAAAEWILSRDAEGNEPWVFVINRTGRITHRFDNVANEAVLDAAIQEALR